MDPISYFNNINSPSQKRYEAMRALYCDKLSLEKTAMKFGWSKGYLKKCKCEFSKSIKTGSNPFFLPTKTGPKNKRTEYSTVDQIILLRKKNHSITDIKAILNGQNISISYDTINKILKSEGFAPLLKRTKQERLNVQLPKQIIAPKSKALNLTKESFSTEIGGGVLTFLPLIENLGVIKAIKSSGFPSTSQLSDVQLILSFLALKLIGSKRWSHDDKWNLDRALGLFAGLNVLPKATTLSTYSYSITREHNIKFLSQLSKIFNYSGEFNLDFKTIPHWGDESVLEKNWSGAKNKIIKSILALIVQDPNTGMISYTDATIKRKNEKNAAIEFVDFWKTSANQTPKMLIFDSKFTTYENLNKLNKDNIQFLTLRRRSKALIANIIGLPDSAWEKISITRTKGKKQKIKIYESSITLRHYEGEMRQVVLTDHGRKNPTFLITNDFEISSKNIVRKYAKRWLVEQEIAEQIAFFHLNTPGSSIVVKVDFDLTISLLAHNLYRVLAQSLPGFEQCQAQTLYRKFIENGATIQIESHTISIKLKKKTHMPFLLEVPWVKKITNIKRLDSDFQFSLDSTS